MTTVYVMLVHWIDEGDGVDDVRTRCKPRVFHSAEIRADAARRFIDEQITNVNNRIMHTQVNSVIHAMHIAELRDVIEDIQYARQMGDLSYELMCCHDAFQFEFEFEDLVVELEEVLGDVVKA